MIICFFRPVLTKKIYGIFKYTDHYGVILNIKLDGINVIKQNNDNIGKNVLAKLITII